MAYLVAAIVMTLSVLEGHFSISSLYRCDISYLCLWRVASAELLVANVVILPSVNVVVISSVVIAADVTADSEQQQQQMTAFTLRTTTTATTKHRNNNKTTTITATKLVICIP